MAETQANPLQSSLATLAKPHCTGFFISTPQRKFSVCQRWRENIANFCRTTTGHGFSKLVNPDEPVAIRALWAVVLFSLALLLVGSVATITRNTFNHRNMYHYQVLKNNKSMIYPSLHVCEQSLFKRSRLQSMNITATMATYLALSLSTSPMPESLRGNQQLRAELEAHFRDLLDRHGPLTEILSKTTLQCEDLIAGCARTTKIYSAQECCHQFFGNQVHLNEFGACLSTFGQSEIREYLPSQATGLILHLKANKDRIDFDSNLMVSSLAMKAGITFAAQESATHTFAALAYRGRNIAPGYSATSPITLEIVDNLNLENAFLAPYSCIDHHKPRSLDLVPGFKQYSKLNCKLATIQRFAEESLNCSLLSIPSARILEACYPEQLLSFFNLHNVKRIRNYTRENCFIDCLEYKYDFAVHATKMSSNLPEPSDANSLISLHFFFPSFTYNYVENYPESLIKWLGDVGGTMGLCLGASIVTVIELIIFCSQSLYRCCKRAEKEDNAVRDPGGS